MPHPDTPPLTRAVVVRGIGFGVAIALGAVAVWLIVTGSTEPRRIEIGVLAGLWGLLLGAYTMFGARRQHVESTVFAAHSELAHRSSGGLEAIGQAEARRAFEERLEHLLRTEISNSVNREVGDLRREVAQLRHELLEKVGGQLRLERIETTRLIGSDLEALQHEVQQLKTARESIVTARPAVDAAAVDAAQAESARALQAAAEQTRIEKARREQAERRAAAEQARAKAAAEQAAREKAAREQAERDVARDKAEREKAAREQSQREQLAREKAARDQAEREKAAQDKAQREQAARDEAQQAAREHAAREQVAAEHAARERAERERVAREAAAAEQARRRAAAEQSAREQAAREQAAREQAAREQAAGEQAAREQAERRSALPATGSSPDPFASLPRITPFTDFELDPVETTAPVLGGPNGEARPNGYTGRRRADSDGADSGRHSAGQAHDAGFEQAMDSSRHSATAGGDDMDDMDGPAGRRRRGDEGGAGGLDLLSQLLSRESAER